MYLISLSAFSKFIVCVIYSQLSLEPFGNIRRIKVGKRSETYPFSYSDTDRLIKTYHHNTVSSRMAYANTLPTIIQVNSTHGGNTFYRRL